MNDTEDSGPRDVEPHSADRVGDSAQSAGDCPAAPPGTPHVTDDAGTRCLRCHNYTRSVGSASPELRASLGAERAEMLLRTQRADWRAEAAESEAQRLRGALERIVLTLEHSEWFGTTYETREDEAKRIARSALQTHPSPKST